VSALWQMVFFDVAVPQSICAKMPPLRPATMDSRRQRSKLIDPLRLGER
jgi:hypothetical protein